MTAPAPSESGTDPSEPTYLHDDHPLAALRFDNRFTTELPADPLTATASRQVPGAAFSRVMPVVAPDPEILHHSEELSDKLGIEPGAWSTPEAAQVFTGGLLLPGSDPHAMNYGGHQFGNWAGQLGDGRAIALGEILDRAGDHQTLQLKGAGPTPYSRRADGLAVLRSSVREYLCSEAMHHLGVPTTRALSLATTGSDVMRDMFYDGHPELEPGAVVCRVAPSFLRFGNYQLFAARGEIDVLRQLVEFTITHHAGHHVPSSGTIDGDAVASWFAEVCERTCDLVVEWMRVGFVHGVLNTDNLSIHGLTIDYGPYGWLDDYDPDWTPNTTDAAGRRYRFGYQPQIAQWNLLQLGNALVPVVGETEPLEASITAYVDRFRSRYRAMMLAKLGLSARDDATDDELIDALHAALVATEVDMTIFFRRLAAVEPDSGDGEAAPLDTVLAPDGLGGALYEPASLSDEAGATIGDFVDRYRRRAASEPAQRERVAAMNAVNPVYVLRNYLAQLAIDAATEGDTSVLDRLAGVLRHPYVEQPGADDLAEKRPDWARTRPGCSMLSCSS